MLLEVHLAGSTQFFITYVVYQLGIFLLVKMYAHYVATCVTWISVYSLHLEMNACTNEYLWCVCTATYLSFNVQRPFTKVSNH